MDDLTMWSLLVGVLLPPLVAVVNREHWMAAVKGLVTVGSSIAAGGVTAYLGGALTGGTWLHAALVVAVAAVGSYHAWWKPTDIAPAIEEATTPAGK
jgi:hypothetical protein